MVIRRVDVPHPARTINIAANPKDTANGDMLQFSFQRKPVQDFHSRQPNKNDAPTSSTMGADPNTPSSASAVPTPQNKRRNSFVADNDSDSDVHLFMS